MHALFSQSCITVLLNMKFQCNNKELLIAEMMIKCPFMYHLNASFINQIIIAFLNVSEVIKTVGQSRAGIHISGFIISC